MSKSLWTDTQVKMITEDGNIKRYIYSDIVDEFNAGDSADISFPNGYGKANRVFKGYVPTLACVTIKSIIVKEENMNLRIRKLTPKECFRLMGFSDEDHNKAASVPTSDTQLYKQAGNSIVVDVLEEILCNLLDETGEIYV